MLAFYGGRGDEERIVENHIKKVAEIITEIATPAYKIIRIPQQDNDFPEGITFSSEITETFNEVILNKVIKEKKIMSCTHAIIILSRNAFPNNNVFEEVVKDSLKDELIYQMICTRGNFVDYEQRKKCYKRSCAQCNDLKDCEHSCLPRLIWVLFDKNNNVLNVF